MLTMKFKQVVKININYKFQYIILITGGSYGAGISSLISFLPTLSSYGAKTYIYIFHKKKKMPKNLKTNSND